MYRFKLTLLVALLMVYFYAPTKAQTPPTAYRLAGHLGDKIYTFDWSPDGTFIVTGSAGIGWKIGDQINTDEPLVKIWSISFTDGQLVATETLSINNFSEGIRLVKWSPDGNKIAILEDKADTLLIWDVQRQEFSAEIPFISYQMYWSPDSQSLIFAAQQVYVVDAQTGQVLYSLSLPPEEQPTTTNPWSITDAQVNPTGDLLAAVTPLRNEQYKFIIWNLEEEGEPLIIDNVGYDMAWSPDGQYLATNTGTYNARTGEKVIDSSTFTFGFLHPSWSFDGTYLATADFIFDVSAGVPVEPASEGTPYYTAIETAWSPRDNVVACLKSDGTIDLWAIVTPPNAVPEANAGPDQTATASSTGTALVTLDGSGSSDSDGTITAYQWRENDTLIAEGATSQVELGVGEHTITLTVVDDDSAIDTDEVLIIVNAPTPTETPTPTVPPTGNGTGLQGQYFNKKDFTRLVLTRTDATINFDWGKESPDPLVQKNAFSVRWTGQVEPMYTETYTFYTLSDDGVRLWVNGQLLIERWNNHSVREDSGTITLVAGQQYDIKLEYYEDGGNAVAKLLWSSPSQVKEIIPQSQLYLPAP